MEHTQTTYKAMGSLKCDRLRYLILSNVVKAFTRKLREVYAVYPAALLGFSILWGVGKHFWWENPGKSCSDKQETVAFTDVNEKEAFKLVSNTLQLAGWHRYPFEASSLLHMLVWYLFQKSHQNSCTLITPVLNIWFSYALSFFDGHLYFKITMYFFFLSQRLLPAFNCVLNDKDLF